MIRPAGPNLVLDASAVIELLVDFRGLGPDVASAVEARGAQRNTLGLCDLEVLAALRSMVLRGGFPSARAEKAHAMYHALPLQRHDHEALLPRIWQLRDNFTPYDAAYVALAEAFGARLVTADDRLKQAVRRHTAVEVVP